MGTAKWTATVKYFLALMAFLFSTAALADPVATNRVIQFLTNAHTGRSMRASEWLGKDVRDADKFKAFGGLDRLIEQSTARAHEYKGLKSVSILEVKEEGPAYVVKAEVKFIADHRKADSRAAAEREDMVWNIRVAKENGKWKLWL